MRPRLQPKETTTIFEQAEAWAKLGLPLLGSLYVLGFVVDALYLAKYGVSPLGFVRAQYLLAGVWAVVPLAILAAAIAIVAWAILNEVNEAIAKAADVPEERWRELKAPPGFRRFVTHPAGRTLMQSYNVLIGLIALVLVVVCSLTWVTRQFPRSQTVTLGHLLAAMRWVPVYALGIALSGALCISGLRREGSRSITESVTGLALTIVLIVGYLGYFAAEVYPLIPSVLGGGQPVRTRFVLKAPVYGLTFDKNGLTPAYDVLVSSEKTIVIVDKQKSAEYSRDLFNAVIIESAR